uniref:GOLD domain-containing protein n=1 Tax=Pygocentrus nattereri TaxID=42514 RepID=A0AAR2KZR5_PYGNA
MNRVLHWVGMTNRSKPALNKVTAGFLKITDTPKNTKVQKLITFTLFSYCPPLLYALKSFPLPHCTQELLNNFFCVQVLLMKRFGRYGKFTFTSHASGQHFICAKSNSTRFSVFAGERLKVHMDVQMGEHVIDPSAEKAKDTVKTMEYKIRHLIDQIRYISKQQDFQRDREETFRQMSEETNGNVLWWAIIQTLILLTVGVWQMRSLKNFLIEKKLV